MKFFRAYIITLIIGVLLALVLTVSTKDEGNTLTNAEQRDYNDGWTIITETGEDYYNELPQRILKGESREVIMKKRLPEDIKSGDAIAFYLGDNVIHAYVDEKEVYTFDVPKAYEKVSKTPGTNWNFINLTTKDSGKMLTIRLQPVYQSEKEKLPSMIYGDKTKIVIGLITERAGELIFSALLFCLGGALMLCMMLFKEQLRISGYIYWLGVFALNVAAWSFIQTRLITLIYAQNVRGIRITYIAFQTLLIPLVSYVKNFCREENEKIYDALCIAGAAVLAVTSILQFTGIKDYGETMWIIYVLWAANFVWLVFIVFKRLIKGGYKEKRVWVIQAVSLLAVMAAIAVDMTEYLQAETVDAARLSRPVLLVYLLVQVYLLFEDSVKLIRLGEQAEVISKEALRDALTKLGNRTAFQKDMEGYQAKKESAAVMFDLNNLKYFNDVHGHATGDYYIIVCSEIIQDIFGCYGKVYRMGGDEFCAVIENVDEDKFMELQRNMNDRIDALNGRFFENKMSVASGYANYDSEKDQDIHDSIRRADENMYECKSAMKQRG